MFALVATSMAANLQRSKRGIFGGGHHDDHYQHVHLEPYHAHHEHHVQTIPIPIVKHVPVPVDRIIIKKIIQKVHVPEVRTLMINFDLIYWTYRKYFIAIYYH